MTGARAKSGAEIAFVINEDRRGGNWFAPVIARRALVPPI
jgi:hypothetical protein